MSASLKMKDQSGIEPKIAGTPNLKLVRAEALAAGRDPLSERWMGKTIQRHVLEFGQVFALIGLIVAIVALRKEWSFSFVAAPLLFAAVILAGAKFTPNLMRPLWSGWMKLAMILGHVMTTLILGIMWTLVLLPIALLLRIIGKRVMDTSFDRSRTSYWQARDPRNDDFELLLRQF